jgi:hypothetical protein
MPLQADLSGNQTTKEVRELVREIIDVEVE